jgi:hypothetical protein
VKHVLLIRLAPIYKWCLQLCAHRSRASRGWASMQLAAAAEAALAASSFPQPQHAQPARQRRRANGRRRRPPCSSTSCGMLCAQTLGNGPTAQQPAQLHGRSQNAGTVQSNVASRLRLTISRCRYKLSPVAKAIMDPASGDSRTPDAAAADAELRGGDPTLGISATAGLPPPTNCAADARSLLMTSGRGEVAGEAAGEAADGGPLASADVGKVVCASGIATEPSLGRREEAALCCGAAGCGLQQQQ